MNKTFSTVLGIVLGLAIGVGVMTVKYRIDERRQIGDALSGMHMMPDGTMMANDARMASPEPASMKHQMDSMMMGLDGKTGDEFDQAFLAEMIVHHQGAVEMAQAALTNAKHEDLKALARTIISAQQSEIARMQYWQSEWYGQ